MSPVHTDELTPDVRARVPEQISGPEGGTTALATVEKETFLTLGDPAAMTDDQLADIVIGGFNKMRQYLPYILAMKNRFSAGARDSANRLKNPIKGCHSWLEFCSTCLHRTPQTIGELLAESQGIACVCPDCNQPFPSKGKLRKHQNKMHPRRFVSPAVFEIESVNTPTEPAAERSAIKMVAAYDAQFAPPTTPTPESAAQPIIDAEFVDAPQPAEAPPSNTDRNLSHAVPLREWFTQRYATFKLQPAANNLRGFGGRMGRFDLTLFNLSPAQVRAVGNILAEGKKGLDYLQQLIDAQTPEPEPEPEPDAPPATIEEPTS